MRRICPSLLSSPTVVGPCSRPRISRSRLRDGANFISCSSRTSVLAMSRRPMVPTNGEGFQSQAHVSRPRSANPSSHSPYRCKPLANSSNVPPRQGFAHDFSSNLRTCDSELDFFALQVPRLIRRALDTLFYLHLHDQAALASTLPSFVDRIVSRAIEDAELSILRMFCSNQVDGLERMELLISTEGAKLWAIAEDMKSDL